MIKLHHQTAAFILHSLFTADLLHHYCFLIMQQSWGSHTQYCESVCLVEQPAKVNTTVEKTLHGDDANQRRSNLYWHRDLLRLNANIT